MGRFVRLGVLTLAFAGLLSACSASAASSDGVLTLAGAAPGATGTPSASPADPEAAMLDYAQCMRDHGLDFPDPAIAGTGVSGGGTSISEAGHGPGSNPKSNPGFQAANTACLHFLASTRNSIDAKPLSAAEQRAFLEFSACMRDHGIDMPDPDFTDGGASFQADNGGQGGPAIDPRSPAFRTAQNACQQVMTDAGLKGPNGDAGTSSKPAHPDATSGTATEAPAL